jgi:serpin B
MTDHDDDGTDLLRTLRAPANPPAWADPEQLRRRGRARRRRTTVLRSSAGAAVVAAAVTVAVVAVPADHHPRPHEAIATNLQVGDRQGNAVELVAANRTLSPPNGSARTSIADAEVDFAVKLLRQIQPKASANCVVSPSSLSIALAMLNYGARGRTQDQIAALLAPKGTSAATIAAGWSTLVADWAKAAARDKVTLASANSVWLQRNAVLTQAFTDALASYFDSGVWQVDFQADPAGAARDLNAWVSRATHGKVRDLVTKDEVDGLLLVLVNAVYFNAHWLHPFDTVTDPAPFTTGTGASKQVITMTNRADLPTLSNDEVNAAQLAYRGGRFAALLLEPKKTSLANYVNGLSRAGIADVVGQLRPHGIGVLMPVLSIASTTDLKPALKALGVKDAFSSTAADLQGLSSAADYVAWVKQKATLGVTTTGTTAIAATAIGVVPVSTGPMQPASVKFDHPFLFIIRDVQTGAIVFSAEINDPSVAN